MTTGPDATERRPEKSDPVRLLPSSASRAARIVAIYALFAALWIYFSDRALLLLVRDRVELEQWSVFKGLAFVALTSLLLFMLLGRAFARETERWRALRAAADEKSFSEKMIESLPGIAYFYDAEGHFLRWNRNFVAVSGYSDEALTGMHPLDFFAGEDKLRVGAKIAEVFERGEAEVEAGFLTREGRVVPHLFTARRVFFNGQWCLVGMGIDVSERERAERALRELNESLESRVAARTEELHAAMIRAEAADKVKSAFLASMSHELRTPLNSIIGFTGIMQQGLAGPLTPEQARQLEMVRSSARHLLELINDVLDLSRIEAGQLDVRSEPFDLPASIERTAASVRPLLEKKKLSLSLRIAPELGEMVSDRRRVEQILLNLLNNAIKFTDEGSVTVTAEMADPASVRLRVTDTGMGIRQDDLTTLFQPFRQLDTGLSRMHEGSGLGLAICRRLAALLGGEISATSEWGKGSEFSVVLPLRRLS